MPRIKLSIQGTFLAQPLQSICQNVINEYVEDSGRTTMFGQWIGLMRGRHEDCCCVQHRPPLQKVQKTHIQYHSESLSQQRLCPESCWLPGLTGMTTVQNRRSKDRPDDRPIHKCRLFCAD